VIQGPRRPRTALVVSADPAVRADWARHFEGLGMRTIRCVGPRVTCALLDDERCPLHDDADLAVYDRAALTPELTLKLAGIGDEFPLVFASDRLDAEGRHEAVVR
jgi:hypothetical protein